MLIQTIGLNGLHASGFMYILASSSCSAGKATYLSCRTFLRKARNIDQVAYSSRNLSLSAESRLISCLFTRIQCYIEVHVIRATWYLQSLRSSTHFFFRVCAKLERLPARKMSIRQSSAQFAFRVIEISQSTLNEIDQTLYDKKTVDSVTL
jgi:hypothetical protein